MTQGLDKKTREHLRKTANMFLKSVGEMVDSYILLEDVDGLSGLVSLVDMYSGWRVLKALRDKGFEKEITALCDKAGQK